MEYLSHDSIWDGHLKVIHSHTNVYPNPIADKLDNILTLLKVIFYFPTVQSTILGISTTLYKVRPARPADLSVGQAWFRDVYGGYNYRIYYNWEFPSMGVARMNCLQWTLLFKMDS